MFSECLTQPHSKFSITNQKDKDLWEGPSDAVMSLRKATRHKTWKAGGDGD